MQENKNTENDNQSNDNKDFADKTIESVEKFMNTKDYANLYTKEEMNKYKISAIVCYMPLVVFYFIITQKYKHSKYLFFHVNQGLNISILWVIVFIISGLLKSLFTVDSLIRSYLPGWISFIIYVLYCCSFFLSLFGIINTSNGKSKELPIIGKFKILKD